ncbi:MAG: hypothetical protein P8P48_08655 [Saprospiraceae bacterium]|nr:hypothetical protein [Saprospiraceae bacterium]
MKILASIIAFAFAFNLNAQTNLKDLTLPTSTEEFTSFFNLNDDQVKKLESFTDRKSNQINLIKELKGSDLTTYISKRNAINKGFLTSIEMMLNEVQLVELKKYISLIRMENQEIRQNLSKTGKSEQEIKLAIVEN